MLEVQPGPVDVPAEFFAGPREKGVHRAPGGDGDGEVRHRQVGPGAGRALQELAVAGDDQRVVAVVVEGVQVPAAADDPQQDLLPGCIIAMEP